MKLFVGLGNPGADYARNRHNVGFMAIEAVAARHGFSPWRKRFQGLVAEGSLDGEKIVALKPQTYMNNSGRAVGEAVRFFKLEPSAVHVFYDELDLVPGKLRVKQGGGAGGHNGIRDITAQIGAEFWRVRIGIGHPGHKDAVLGHVLNDFAKVDREWVVAMLDAIAEAAPLLAKGDPNAFMSKVDVLTRPARDPAPPNASPRPQAGRNAPEAATPETPPQSTPPPLAGEPEKTATKPMGALQAALARALGRKP
ncbi:MAG: aminoacyl-tRNA hydrolase [Alphaproteobacteria bacterium]